MIVSQPTPPSPPPLAHQSAVGFLFLSPSMNPRQAAGGGAPKTGAWEFSLIGSTWSISKCHFIMILQAHLRGVGD